MMVFVLRLQDLRFNSYILLDGSLIVNLICNLVHFFFFPTSVL